MYQKPTFSVDRLPLKELWSAVLLPCLCLGLATTAILLYAYDATISVTRDNIANDMRAIAKLKVGQIEHWLADHHDDTQLIATTQFNHDLQRWLTGGRRDETLKQLLIDRLTTPHTTQEPRNFALRATDGRLLLEAGIVNDSMEAQQLAREAAHSGQSILESMHFASATLRRDRSHPPIEMGYFTPLSLPNDSTVLAVLQSRFSPESTLYPLLQHWPGVSTSAETMILVRHGDRVVYLNELRHLPNSALRVSRPLEGASLIAARVIAEGEGFFEEADYRGIPSLAYGIRIEGTSWILIAKIDRSEAFHRIDTIACIVSSLCGLMLLACAVWLYMRKLRELQLAKLLTECQDLYQQAPCGYHSLDRNGMFLRINDTELRMLGYTREELIGKVNVRQLMTETSQRQFDTVIRRAVALEEIRGIECELIRKDGSIISALINASAILDHKGEFLMTRTMVYDISERKRHEEEMHLMHHALESSAHGMMILRLDAASLPHISYVNPAFEQMTGYRAEEALGRTPAFLHGQDGALPSIDELRNAFDHSLNHKATLRFFRKNRLPFWGEVIASPVRTPDGDITHYIAIVDDITQRMAIEAELLESREQLRKLASHDDAIRETERKHMARELHDELGQALTVLKMNIALLQMRFDTLPELMDKTEGMRIIIEKTISVVRNVVSSLRPAALDLGIVGALEWLADDFTRHTTMPCTYEGDGDEPAIDDKTATVAFRIAQESLTNIARHAHARKVRIRLTCDHGILRLSVTDDGCGFDTSEIILNRNHFGLLGMQERVSMLAGKFHLSSTPGQGTSINIELPLTPPPHL